jgi:hypothetical protein
MRKKFLKIAIIITMLVVAFATVVNALSLTVAMEVTNTTVPEKTEFTVKVKVANLDVGQNGINSINAVLKYDEKIFETVSESSIEGMNGWEAKYDNNTKKITLTKQAFVKTEEDVFNLTLKTKEGVSGKEGIVELKEINALNSDSTITATDVSVAINVGQVSGNTANTSNTGNTQNIITLTNKANNTSNNTNTNKAVNNVVNNTNTNNAESTNTSIPATGVEDGIVFLIFGAIILAIIVYIRIELINREIKK